MRKVRKVMKFKTLTPPEVVVLTAAAKESPKAWAKRIRRRHVWIKEVLDARPNGPPTHTAVASYGCPHCINAPDCDKCILGRAIHKHWPGCTITSTACVRTLTWGGVKQGQTMIRYGTHDVRVLPVASALAWASSAYYTKMPPCEEDVRVATQIMIDAHFEWVALIEELGK